MASVLPHRLNFALHPFTRICWVSDRARDVWGPRLKRVATVWPTIEAASVQFGVRRCASLQLSVDAYLAAAPTWASSGLAALPLDDAAGAHSRSKLHVAVGAAADVLAFDGAFRSA